MSLNSAALAASASKVARAPNVTRFKDFACQAPFEYRTVYRTVLEVCSKLFSRRLPGKIENVILVKNA